MTPHRKLLNKYHYLLYIADATTKDNREAKQYIRMASNGLIQGML